ncbi:uncharacterized protein N7484_002493 [Penicillium longicatenatum]|uniref:uncharacterized protein n=1 Tax=Penicillium longicatenatum TaxID=1561947 RepID=UPI002548150C|nr:uncharacterized protein N7484_002493 [Penicillium longicatenatum]KAJ5658844.1 hypothetical protein N7484_002493 [Penicillium longicatenatum]
MGPKIIQLPTGPIKVLRLENTLIHARGIPYAKASRFQVPQPTGTWSDVLDCTTRAPICPQLPSRLEAVMGPLTEGHGMDEDCLHLSITAPQDATQAPVMVWLHGGAYISGSGDLDCYQGIDLAQRGIVCVNITYRLGVFGYLHLDGIAPANLGLLDQSAALQWIQGNIATFGGDSQNVTLVGQSAGADSIICLMAAKNTAGLFHRAILLSPPLRELKERTATGPLVTTMAEKLFTKDPRAMSVDELLVVQKKLLMDPVQKQVMLFAPMLGFDPLPKEQGFDQRINEVARNIPILIGWTAHDGRPFSSMVGPQSLLQLPLVGPYVEALMTWYITQSYFKWPSLRFHEQTLRAGGISTSYSFEWAADDNALGACHCIDIPFVLGAWDAWKTAPMLIGKSTQEDVARLGSDLKDLWVSFMNGNRLKNGHIAISKTIR